MSVKWETVYQFDHLLISTDGQVKAKAKLCRRKDGGKGDSQQRSERNIISSEKQGYRWINIAVPGGSRKFRSVHRMVVETFIRPLNGTEEINHINGKRDDNRLENLEIVADRYEHAKKTFDRIREEAFKAGYQKGLEDAKL